jgi:hypothetical protein
MSIRSTLSSLVAGAVLIGLTGISSPAFAAPPTITIDSSASGCFAATNVEFDGMPESEYFESNWNGSSGQSTITANVTCDGNVLDLSWQEIDLQADADLTLTVPDLSDVSVSNHDGVVTSPWG